MGETSAEAGTPLQSFAVFDLLSLESQQEVPFRDEEGQSRIWFWSCSF